MKKVKARKDDVAGALRRAASSGRCEAIARTAPSIRATPASLRRSEVAVGGEIADAPQDLHQRRRPRRRAGHPGPRRGRRTSPTARMLDVDFLPPHLVIVGGSYIGLEFAPDVPPLRQRGDGHRDGAAADPARGRGRLRGRRRHSSKREGIDVRTERGLPASSRKRGDDIAVQLRLPEAAMRGRRLASAARRRPAAQHRRSRPRQGRRRSTTSAASSRSTISCAPTCRASGRWATATAGAPSPTPPTTTSRSSPPTCSTTTQRRVSDRIPAYELYTDPPLGRVGMTEAEVRKIGRRR